ncbi:hypothetical protein [Paramaledivibacter caminithermalis]|uniref:Uncharacterized protein n=1 Tax=Paramaledivibacter caminithermalis (strain DSM 15212 / CIP 107654 / DViRD3) TaxID=1121301 RepID=A0A1M6T7L1_PARC5|nr:hypothetical protein [Paramaledivibacter caminithermalis]SHK52977.1 hypothetical protein SAMN02745912_03592 [Paramaledivibacter caminithermalis DSM 15212]
MNLVEKYKTYRKVLVKLHMKILDEFVSQSDFERGGKILDIVKNNKVVFQYYNEKDILFDFIIYEKIRDGHSALSEYEKRYGAKNSNEEEILAAMKLSETSLYEVIGINKENSTILLRDILNNSKKSKLLDIGLSKSINTNVLVFTRLIKFDEFNMTSGLGLAFSGNYRDFLIRKSKKIMKKTKSGDTSVDRFVAFFKLSRTDGIPILFESVK